MHPHCSTSTDSLPFRVSDARKRGYFTVDNVILDDYGEQLGPHGLAVYVALCRFANADQECWPSHATVAKRTGMSKTQVKREVAKLARLELILVTPRSDPSTGEHTSNLYTLLDVQGWVHSGPTEGVQGKSTQYPPRPRVAHRTKPKKKDPPQTEEERRRSYLPDDLRDIILG